MSTVAQSTAESRPNGADFADSAWLRTCVLDTERCVRDKATTQPSEHDPESPRPATRTRGRAAYRYISSAAFDALARELCDTEAERRLLQAVWDHLEDGGIIIFHGGDVVLTWADGGMSRRLAAGSWG